MLVFVGGSTRSVPQNLQNHGFACTFKALNTRILEKHKLLARLLVRHM